jgi:hypothetical protein
VVSPPGNGFLSFLSLSSFIDLPHQYFCLGGNLFNAHRNYHKYPLGVPVTKRRRFLCGDTASYTHTPWTACTRSTQWVPRSDPPLDSCWDHTSTDTPGF